MSKNAHVNDILFSLNGSISYRLAWAIAYYTVGSPDLARGAKVDDKLIVPTPLLYLLTADVWGLVGTKQKNMKKNFLGVLIYLLSSVAIHAQVGYQVSLLNSATGEPRANETVSADIVITDSKGGTVYSSTQSATTNDFGVLSFVVGDANTFKDVAIGRLPLYISVTVGGTLIGKSQILNVPVAEVATTLKSDFTLEELCSKTWTVYRVMLFPNLPDGEGTLEITFYTNGTWTSKQRWPGDAPGVFTFNNGKYEVEGNTIYTYDYSYNGNMVIFRLYNSSLYTTWTF